MKQSTKLLPISALLLLLAAIPCGANAGENDPGASAAQSAVRNERDVISLRERHQLQEGATIRPEKAPDPSTQTRKLVPSSDISPTK
jgi:hypothetical protein